MDSRLRLGLLVLIASAAVAQLRPRVFEVVSIRPRAVPYSTIGISTSGARFAAEAANVRLLIMYAYGLKNFQLPDTQALASIGDIRYDVHAKAEGEGIPTKGQFRQMLQFALADRFQLKLHRELKPTSVYALTLGKNRPKLKESPSGETAAGHMGVIGRNNVVNLAAATMDDLVDQIGNAFLDRPVIDRTGLTGMYDISLTYTPGTRFGRGDPDPGDMSIFTALQQQLGLRLLPQKVEMEIMVVDQVKEPTPN